MLQAAALLHPNERRSASPVRPSAGSQTEAGRPAARSAARAQRSRHGLALTALRRLAAAGHPDLRIGHGFVVQHLVDGPVRIGELTARMGVTQQAASKAVAELEGLGYLERIPDPDDGRVRRVGLSARGAEGVVTTRAVRAEIERELSAALGTETVAAARRTALAALEWAGGAPARTR